MKAVLCILSLVCLLMTANAQDQSTAYIRFFDDSIPVQAPALQKIEPGPSISQRAVFDFYARMESSVLKGLTKDLMAFRAKHQLNDWLYYQLIRRTAQLISPKADNYDRYTLYKWYFLLASGYDVRLALYEHRLLMYVQSDDKIFDIPLFQKDGKQYVCLNIHDFGPVNMEAVTLHPVECPSTGVKIPFQYQVRKIPSFRQQAYEEKELVFYYHDREDRFRIRLNPEWNALFTNYPSLDFENYFNIPMGQLTYNSLIPVLKKKVGRMKPAKGVDYLMQFTRHAFPYENDLQAFGKEKRLSPEQTLFYQYSDCDDRAALFYYLVKEIYNLPMIALMYPDHITIAVAFDRPIGDPILYNGRAYTICEPTPQLQETSIGQIPESRKHQPFEVVYAYTPVVN